MAQIINLTDKLKNKLIEKFKKDLNDLGKQTKNKIQMEIPLEVKKGFKKPKVVFTKTAWEKCKALVDNCGTEIGWRGFVTKNKNVYTISDIVVYPQIATGSTITTDDDELFKFEMSIPTAQFNTMRMQGHSHCNFAATPSGQDESMYQTFLNGLGPKDYFIFMILNKREQLYMRIYDLEANLKFENEEIEVVIPTPKISEWAEKEIKEKVKSRYEYNRSAVSKYSDNADTTSKVTTFTPQPKAWWETQEGQNAMLRGVMQEYDGVPIGDSFHSGHTFKNDAERQAYIETLKSL